MFDLNSDSQTAVAFPDVIFFSSECKMFLLLTRENSPVLEESFNALFLMQKFSFSNGCLCILIDKTYTIT